MAILSLDVGRKTTFMLGGLNPTPLKNMMKVSWDDDSFPTEWTNNVGIAVINHPPHHKWVGFHQKSGWFNDIAKNPHELRHVPGKPPTR